MNRMPWLQLCILDDIRTPTAGSKLAMITDTASAAEATVALQITLACLAKTWSFWTFLGVQYLLWEITSYLW